MSSPQMSVWEVRVAKIAAYPDFGHFFFHGLLQIPRLFTCIINNQSPSILQGLRVRIFDHWVPALSTNTTPPACPPLLASRGSSVHTKWGTRATQGWLENVGKHWEGTRAPPRFWARKKHSFHRFPDVCWYFKIINPLIFRWAARPHISLKPIQIIEFQWLS